MVYQILTSHSDPFIAMPKAKRGLKSFVLAGESSQSLRDLPRVLSSSVNDSDRG